MHFPDGHKHHDCRNAKARREPKGVGSESIQADSEEPWRKGLGYASGNHQKALSVAIAVGAKDH
ncbi:hypothetical protein CBM2585_A130010 [Cupriavidus taiwanensis]|nr:hypothetical protein CBM2585_A130010 [Cupriavidus taiwanensis]